MNNIFGPAAGVMLLVAAPAIAQTSAAPAAAQPGAAAQGADPAKLAEAHAIIQIMFPPAEREQMVGKMLTTITAQMRTPMPAYLSQDPGLKNILDDFMTKVEAQEKPLLMKHLPDLLEADAIAYTHEFSLPELKEIHAFGLTPAGSHYLSRLTALLSDPAVAKVNTALIADARALPQSMMPELKDKLVTYVKAHPDLAAKIAAEAKTQ